MLTVVTWKWARPGYRSTFGPETVNVLKKMVDRHYPDPHRFVCVTDDGAGLDSGIDVVSLWNDYADLPHPTNAAQPSCYRRLKAFAPEMRDIFGTRFVSVDLDCVIVDDLRPLWNRPEAFVGLAGTQPPTTFNGSMFLMTAGARPQVWADFNPMYSPLNARRAGHYGSDQAWISYVLGAGEARWTPADGVYTYRLHVEPAHGRLPRGARIVFFAGKKDPWNKDVLALDWVKANWC